MGSKEAFIQLILDAPAMEPPDGVHPNFSNPPNADTAVWGINMVTLTITVLSLAMRLYIQLRVHKKLFLEDYCLIVAFLGLIGYTVPCFRILLQTHILVHQWNYRVKDLTPMLFNYNIACITYLVCIKFLKIAILLQYTRLFFPRRIHRNLYWTCHALIWLHIVLHTICYGLHIWTCNPRRKLWNPVTVEGTCMNTYAITLSLCCFNFVSDLIIVILPQRAIWKLQLRPRKKVGVSIIFLVASFGCAVAGMRVYYSVQAMISADKTFNLTAVGLCAFGEFGAGFFAACLPSAPKFFHETKLLSSFSRPSFLSLSSGRENASLPRRWFPSATTAGEKISSTEQSLELVRNGPADLKGSCPAFERSDGLGDEQGMPVQRTRIVRTTHIATAGELRDDSTVPLEQAVYRPWEDTYIERGLTFM